MDIITNHDIQKLRNKFNNKSNKIKNHLSMNAISNNNINNIILERECLSGTNKCTVRNKVFKKKINIETKNTNQKNSGRCWIFAFLNIVRLKMIDKYNLPPEFQFSQNYLFFFDKLEKSNFFLNNIFLTKDKPIDSRLVSFLLELPTNDGGQWNMLVNLVNKYGIIPKTAMRESFSSSNSDQLNFFLNNKLRDYAYIIRNKINHKTSLTKIKSYKSKFLYEIYQILAIFLGEPPKTILWEYYEIDNKSTNYKSIQDITPFDFYKKYVPFDINDYKTIINVPCKCKPFYKTYNLKNFGNAIEGINTQYLNLPIQMIKKIAKKSIDGNDAIWFGSDVDKYFNPIQGTLNIESFNYRNVFGFDLNLNKGQRVQYGMSTITHAMIIKGYDEINGKINKWLVENSWGNDNELSGDVIMTDKWFSEFVLEMVVHKKYLHPNIIKLWNKTPINLEPWDPIGVLLNINNDTSISLNFPLLQNLKITKTKNKTKAKSNHITKTKKKIKQKL